MELCTGAATVERVAANRNHASRGDREAGLSQKDFTRLSAFVHEHCGIKLPPSKKTMLEARLRRRLRALDFRSYDDYCEYLFGPEGQKEEIVRMIDLVTTNKTDFFREPAHFEFLVRSCLPELCDGGRGGGWRGLSVWSAGCSSGEEPYTLAMVLSEFAESRPGFRFSILATDISTKVLEKAAVGIYDEERVEPVPAAMKRKYMLKSKDRSKGLVRVVPALRSLVDFRRLNLMDDDFGIREPMDVIFCRNVIIYFDKATQEGLVNRFARHLAPGGYLFLGHSETLCGMDAPLVQMAPTVYRRPDWAEPARG